MKNKTNKSDNKYEWKNFRCTFIKQYVILLLHKRLCGAKTYIIVMLLCSQKRVNPVLMEIKKVDL